MKKIVWACLLCLTVVFLIGGGVAVWARGNSHHPEPGYGAGHDCYLGSNFHNYDHRNNYGTDKNVWCDGTNSQLKPHHTGAAVRAGLAANASFCGGFCLRSETSGNVLTIQYKNVVEHDKVWLQSGDLSYYPIDRAAGDTSVQVEDNGWADRNPAVGIVEAEVLFSKTNASSGSNENSDSGGGCSASGLPPGAVWLLALPFLKKRKAN